jgi:hypothetical protein
MERKKGGLYDPNQSTYRKALYFLDFPFFADFDAFFFAAIFNYIKKISYISFNFADIGDSLFLI